MESTAASSDSICLFAFWAAKLCTLALLYANAKLSYIMKSSWPLKGSDCHRYLCLGLAQTIQLLPKGIHKANQACSEYINYGRCTSRYEFYNHNGDDVIE